MLITSPAASLVKLQQGFLLIESACCKHLFNPDPRPPSGVPSRQQASDYTERRTGSWPRAAAWRTDPPDRRHA